MITRRQLGQAGMTALTGVALMRLFETSKAAAAETFEVNHPKEEWRRLLSPEQFYVLREHGTERAGTSPLDREKRAGTFICAGCEPAALRLRHKFDSGTGWPSFWAPLDGAVGDHGDRSSSWRGPKSTAAAAAAISATSSTTAPSPTGLRYCMNGVAMKFQPSGSDAGQAS